MPRVSKPADLSVVRDQSSKPGHKPGPVERVRHTVRFVLPPSAKVAVITEGKRGLLVLDGRETWPIPRDRKGIYAGPYPRNDGDAVAQVEAARSEGA
jgi:hypothetical protein